jgi:phosphoglycerate dehydrogenase-like enzyme
MGMDVIAFTASPRENVESKRDQRYIIPGTGDPDGSLPSAWYSGTTKASLHHFLEQDIDILLICLPLTKSTTKCIGPEEFKILGKRNAFVLNIARGAIIDQAALSAALRLDLEEGGLKGAAVDVTDREPLPADSEFWDTPNLIITPHISGQALGYYAGVLNILDLNLTKIGEGKQLLNMVNKSKGY